MSDHATTCSKRLREKKNDFYRIHSATTNQLERDMVEVGSKIGGWKVALCQEKAIRITLNQFANQGKNTLRAEGWCPTSSQQVIEGILDDVTKGKGVNKPVLQYAHPWGLRLCRRTLIPMSLRQSSKRS